MKRIIIVIMILTSVLSAFAQELAQPLSLRSEWTPTWVEEDDENGVVVDIAQYTPLVFPWAMKAIGQPTRSGWGRMATSQAFGVVAMVAMTPLITIQCIGLYSELKNRAKHRKIEEAIAQIEDCVLYYDEAHEEVQV